MRDQDTEDGNKALLEFVLKGTANAEHLKDHMQVMSCGKCLKESRLLGSACLPGQCLLEPNAVLSPLSSPIPKHCWVLCEQLTTCCTCLRLEIHLPDSLS